MKIYIWGFFNKGAIIFQVINLLIIWFLCIDIVGLNDQDWYIYIFFIDLDFFYWFRICVFMYFLYII